MWPMQALVNTNFKTRKPERLTRMTVNNIYKVLINVPAVTLDVCSDYAHSTRAILLKLSWTNAVK